MLYMFIYLPIFLNISKAHWFLLTYKKKIVYISSYVKHFGKFIVSHLSRIYGRGLNMSELDGSVSIELVFMLHITVDTFILLHIVYINASRNDFIIVNKHIIKNGLINFIITVILFVASRKS